MSRTELYIENESSESFAFDIRKTAENVCTQVLTNENCPFDAEIALTMVESNRIHEINLQYRGIDRETDVLSFPNLEYDSPGDFSCSGNAAADIRDPQTGMVFLGDIMLNTNRVKSQAAEYGHSERREFAFLIAHSMLHLCGYDHMTEAEAGVMEARQEKALQDLGITRDCQDTDN